MAISDSIPKKKRVSISPYLLAGSSLPTPSFALRQAEFHELDGIAGDTCKAIELLVVCSLGRVILSFFNRFSIDTEDAERLKSSILHRPHGTGLLTVSSYLDSSLHLMFALDC